MNWKPIALFLLIIVLIIPLVSADLGPKSTASFEIEHFSTPDGIEKFHTRLLKCYLPDQNHLQYPADNFPDKFVVLDSDSNCTWATSDLIWGGRWLYGSDFEDGSEEINFSMIPDKFLFAIYSETDDMLYISDVIERKAFNSTYSAALHSDGTISVEETTPFAETNQGQNFNQFILAFIITLFIELLITVILRKAFKAPKSIIALVAIANIITLPIVWFVFPLLQIPLLVFALSELFAVLFEGLFFYFGTKKQISLQNAFVLSLINNIASVMVGGVFLGILMVMQTVRLI